MSVIWTRMIWTRLPLVRGDLRRKAPHTYQKTVAGSVAPSEHPSWPSWTSPMPLPLF